MDWCEIAIETAPEGVEAVSEILYEAEAQGLVIEDGVFEAGGGDESADESLFDAGLKDKPRLKAYFEQNDALADKLQYIKERLDAIREMDLGLQTGTLRISQADIKETDWAENWKKYYKPFKAGHRIVVKPTWESYEARPGETVIALDPGMAFGTGTHETTRMCIEYIEEYVREGMAVLDIGCGSGILSVAAAKCGATRVLSLDRDPVSVRTAGDNARLNGCGEIIEVRKSDLLQEAGDFKADVIAANIIADIVLRLNETAGNYLKPDGVYIVSGIIASREHDVLSSLEANGFAVTGKKEAGEWCAFAAKKA